MLDKYSLPIPFEETPSNISFYFPKMKPPIDRFLDPLSRTVKIKKGSPTGVAEFNDVYLLNGEGMNCLYDSAGERILESCVRRGEAGNELIESHVERIEIPEDCERISEPVVYLSSFYRHWGHFLTESISRLWARYEYPELRGMNGVYRSYFPNQLSNFTYIPEFFSSLSRAPLQLTSVARSTRIDKCFIPAPSFSNRNEAYTSHLRAPHDVARSYLPNGPVDSSDRPVYLSRSQLSGGDRIINNEDELIASLVEHGFLIIHPQQLSLEEQINIFNKHNIFVGCWGSAFHSSLFCLRGASINTYVLCERWINPNYVMFDAIVGNSGNYLCVLARDEREPRVGGIKRYTIDIEACVAQLAHCGVL